MLLGVTCWDLGVMRRFANEPSIVPISLVNWYAGDYTSTASTLKKNKCKPFSTNPKFVWSTWFLATYLQYPFLPQTISLLRHPLQWILGGLFQFHGFGFKISHPFLKEVLPPDILTTPNIRWDMLLLKGLEVLHLCSFKSTSWFVTNQSVSCNNWIWGDLVEKKTMRRLLDAKFFYLGPTCPLWVAK